MAGIGYGITLMMQKKSFTESSSVPAPTRRRRERLEFVRPEIRAPFCGALRISSESDAIFFSLVFINLPGS
jgi:hypothetical protein